MPLPVGLTFVGTAGTITALALWTSNYPSMKAAKIHNYVLTLEAGEAPGGTAWSIETAKERLPGAERGREDVIVAGAIILRYDDGDAGHDEGSGQRPGASIRVLPTLRAG